MQLLIKRLFAKSYSASYSERVFFGLSESMVLVNGTQKFASLDFREVWCADQGLKSCNLISPQALSL